MKAPAWYQKHYRRLLVDMHIPDWEPAFLSHYEPAHMLDCYERAGVSAVMLYCQSHVGLCYWPTRIGKMHSAVQGRDVVAELLEGLKERGIAACGYYSVNYNNWAYWEHPEWRIQPSGERSANSFRQSRYGTCCPNNPGYQTFVMSQIEELIPAYEFDGFFFDDSFWPTICLCPHCCQRYERETGREIPRIIDWTSPEWAAFQDSRERWMSGFIGALTAKAKSLNPELTVYHNFGLALGHWMFGVPLDSAVHHDYLGADLYGDPLEQLVVTRLMLNLSENRPAEFMTSHTIGVREHVQLKTVEQMELQVYAATLHSSAFLFIDWINPDGTVNDAVYDRIGRVYAKTAPYEAYLGGRPVEDIAVYYSSASKMSFAENGRPLHDVDPWSELVPYPHIQAVRGACRNLQQAHLPFGIITRKQLRELDRYKVVILPNVLRMDGEEVEALRRYVQGGGRLYASRYTSLTDTMRGRQDDFMLADLFGCHFAADDIGAMSYLQPCDPTLVEAIAPQRYVSLSPELVMFGPRKERPPVKPLRLQTEVAGRVLGTLTLPYASPAPGTIDDHNWSSIHSDPPWEDTADPILVGHTVGRGKVIYAAADIETTDNEANSRLFLSLIRSLLDTPPSFHTDAHPAIWMTVFHQPTDQRYLVGFLNYQTQTPVVPIPTISFTLRPPDGRQFSALKRLPDETPLPFEQDADGALHATVDNLPLFQMLLAEMDP